MTDRDFSTVRQLLQEQSAIVLDAGKEYLVETRLAPLAHQLNLKSVEELIAQLRQGTGTGLHKQIVEAMVTTETSFFRDHHPFEALRKVVLPELIDQRRKERSLNIWCAACATGQEPYSLAILIRENFPELADWRVSLLATDLSQQVLEKARSGRYGQIEVNRGLPATLLVKYFEQHGTHWQLKPVIRNMIDFRAINLAEAWPVLPPMSLVLIRNVMIYFDVQTKKSILSKVARILGPGGYLLLGGAETTFNLHDSFRRVEPLKGAFFQLVPGALR
jgi:chemotaxis protein methyltransferase CheR